MIEHYKKKYQKYKEKYSMLSINYLIIKAYKKLYNMLGRVYSTFYKKIVFKLPPPLIIILECATVFYIDPLHMEQKEACLEFSFTEVWFHLQ